MNGTTAGTAFTVQVTAQSNGGGTGGNTGGGVGSCAGFTSTRVLVLDWNNPTRVFTSSAGGFGANDAVVVQFTTGPNPSPAGNLPKIVAAEYVSAPSGRIATLSDKACDFGSGLAMGAVTVNGATTVTMPFSVGPNNTGYYASLQPSTTYYINIKNAPGSTCGLSGSCDMYVDLLKPGSGY